MDLSKWGPMTVALVVIVVIAVGAGGGVVITHPETLTFQQYLDDLKAFALAVAGLGVARGVHLGLTAASGQAADGEPDEEHPAASTVPVTDAATIAPDQGDAGAA